jgi:hypothetical protein
MINEITDNNKSIAVTLVLPQELIVEAERVATEKNITLSDEIKYRLIKFIEQNY